MMQSNAVCRVFFSVPRFFPVSSRTRAQLSVSLQLVAKHEVEKLKQKQKVAEVRTMQNFMIVGLGNHHMPGTRHSVGMQVVDELAKSLQAFWWDNSKKFVGNITTVELDNGAKLILLKPRMPMNVNGTSVGKAAVYFDISPENVLLIHDDIDKRVGKISFKDDGSANGHNGVRSVMNSLNTKMIQRLKIGIDRPPTKDQVAEYVLQKFPPDEQKIIDQVVQQCLISLADYIKKKTGFNIMRNIYDRQTLANK